MGSAPTATGQRIDYLIAALSGYSAYKLLVPEPNLDEKEKQAGSDYIKAHYHARWVITDEWCKAGYITEDQRLACAGTPQVEQAATDLVHVCELAADRLVEDGRALVELIANRLIECKTLPGEDVRNILSKSLLKTDEESL
jgi:ATP-dependent Zn protease